MVNTRGITRSSGLDRATRLVALYVVVVLATVAALAVLEHTAPAQATRDAWVHAVIVGVFAVLLPIRLRSARRGSAGAATAVGIIATVLAAVNVVETLIPGLFPTWMRIEMIGIAVLMVAVAASVLLRRR